MDFYGTIGPACADVKLLQQMVEAGMTGIRMNLSHGPLAAHKDWLVMLHKAGVKKLLIDLQGAGITHRPSAAAAVPDRRADRASGRARHPLPYRAGAGCAAPGRSCCWMMASCWHGWTPQSRKHSCAP